MILPFAYSPLLPAANSVRLVQILPGKAGSNIHCRLVDYAIRNDQASGLFEALSYVWGDPAVTGRIYITGTAAGDAQPAYLDVTQNLFAALQRLRDRGLPRVMWIDAICINQDDLDERASQVRFMAKIYSHAMRVVVWLGEKQIDDANVFIVLEAAAQRFQSNRDRTQGLMDIAMDRGLSRLLRAEVCYNNDIPKESLGAFISRPWFSRIWVLQEVAAAQCVVLVCGTSEITGSVFAKGLRLLSESFESVEAVVLGQRLSALIEWDSSPGKKLASNANTHADSLGISEIGELLERFREYQATDRRDKIFALLGMSTDGTAELLVPDYTKSWEMVFADLIRHILGPTSSVTTWNLSDMALVTVAGCAIGVLQNSKKGWMMDSHSMRIAGPSRPPLRWIFRWPGTRYCSEVRSGDIVFLASGASSPSIIRCRGDFFLIIVIAIREPLGAQAHIPGSHNVSDYYNTVNPETLGWNEYLQSITHSQSMITMIWDWSSKQRDSTFDTSFEIELNRILDEHVPRATRLLRHAQLVDGSSRRHDDLQSGFVWHLTNPRNGSQNSADLELLETAWVYGSTYEWLSETIETLRWCSWVLQYPLVDQPHLKMMMIYWREQGYLCKDWLAIRAFLAANASPPGPGNKQLGLLYHDLREPLDDAFFTAFFPSYLHPSPSRSGKVKWPQSAVFTQLVKATLAQSPVMLQNLSTTARDILLRPLPGFKDWFHDQNSAEILRISLTALALLLEAQDGVLSLSRQSLSSFVPSKANLKLCQFLLPLLFVDLPSAHSVLETVVVFALRHTEYNQPSWERSIRTPNMIEKGPHDHHHPSPLGSNSWPTESGPSEGDCGMKNVSASSSAICSDSPRPASPLSSSMYAQPRAMEVSYWPDGLDTSRTDLMHFFDDNVVTLRKYFERTGLYEYASAMDDDCLLPFLHERYNLTAEEHDVEVSREGLIQSLAMFENGAGSPSMTSSVSSGD